MGAAERLRAFRAGYPEKTLAVSGTEWKYRICGGGERALLTPPGGELVNDLAFDLATALAASFRVVYPAYPRLKSLDEISDGLAAILDAENIPRVSVLGASFGGAVAQCMVRRYPARIDRLILSNTGVPLANLVRSVKIANAIPAAMPWPLLRRLLAAATVKLLHGAGAERGFWRNYANQLFARQLTKPDIMANLRIQLDYHRCYRFAPADLDGWMRNWSGKVFIIESDNDVLSAARRKALRDTYPQATLYTFHGAGHAPAFTRPDEYLGVVQRFLK